MIENNAKRSAVSAVRCMAIGVLSAAALAACASSGPSQPQRVSSENPKVTYKYDSDQELLGASEQAAEFCRQYAGTTPQPGPIVDNNDGSESVVFECVPVGGTSSTAAASLPPMTYTYRTSQELLQVSQSAESVCNEMGKHATATIETNVDGTKTVTFKCTP